MRTQKFNHMKGGKIIGLVFFSLSIILIVAVFLLFIEMSVGIIAAISLFISVGVLLFTTYTFYKPSFTEVIFSDSGIISKTHFEKENIPMNEIKGIWYYKDTMDEEYDIVPYSEGDDLKGCMVIIGDIECFTDLDYASMSGINMLCSTFKKGYTALYYRKELDEVLKYYHRKIQNKS
ncbi:MAG: hypothetical protein LIP01_01260 [Tannerellaceae bacterium]|nr:hypothetical protein [Tannerellaceae bacterium]